MTYHKNLRKSTNFIFYILLSEDCNFIVMNKLSVLLSSSAVLKHLILSMITLFSTVSNNILGFSIYTLCGVCCVDIDF